MTATIPNRSEPRGTPLRVALGLRLTAVGLIVMASLAAALWLVQMQLRERTEKERVPQVLQFASQQSRLLDESLLREARLLVSALKDAAHAPKAGAAVRQRGIESALERLQTTGRFKALRLEDAAGQLLFSQGEVPSGTGAGGVLRWAIQQEPAIRVHRVVALETPVAEGQGRWLLFAPVDGATLERLSPPGAYLALVWSGRELLTDARQQAGGSEAPQPQRMAHGADVGWSGAAEDAPRLELRALSQDYLSQQSLWGILASVALASLALGWLVLGRWAQDHVARIDALAGATARFTEERDASDMESERVGARMRGASVEVHQLWRNLLSLSRSVDQAEEDQQAAQQYLRDLNVYLEDRIQERTRELADARDRALDSTRAKEQFLANMSHELRTPLTGLLGGLELVDPTQLPSQQRHLLSVARQSGEALLAVINEVLDYSKLEAGKFVLAQVPLKVPEVAQEVVSLFASVALRKGVALDCICESGVDTPFIGDPLRLRQVLLNLLGNALKFTDRGRVELRITRIARRADSAVLLFSVKDSGIGISPALQTQLFKPFVQADEGAARTGSGLGLAISQRLVQAMGGEITVDSVQGQGSTFSFDLELAFAPQAETAAPADALTQAPAPSTLRGRVLLVEDNPVNRLVATSMLAPLGLEVDEAEDGQQALDKLREGTFDLVLMDCQMPVLDGFAATARIRAGDAGADRVRVPIVAFTANALDGDAQRCLAAGMDGYLSKPFTREQLAATIDHWLRRGRDSASSPTQH